MVTLSAAEAIETVSVLLDDFVQKPVRSGNPMEVVSLMLELSSSPDPAVQFFLLFFFVTMGIPFFGGYDEI